MKSKAVILSLISFFVLSFSSLNASVDINGPGNGYSKLRTKIIEKVESFKDKFQFKSNEKVHICFRVKSDSTITIQSIISKNEQLAGFLMENLDHQILDIVPENFEPKTDYWITLDYTVL